MKTYNILIVAILISLLFSCVNTHAWFDEYNQIVILDKSHFMESISCEISIRDSVGSNYIYSLSFDRVNGGSNYIFGKIKIKESNGYDEKRLHVVDGTNRIHSFSINDFKAIGEDTVNVNLLLEK